MKTPFAAWPVVPALAALVNLALAQDKVTTVTTTTEREVLATNPVPYLIALGIILLIIIAFVFVMVTTKPHKGKYKIEKRDND